MMNQTIKPVTLFRGVTRTAKRVGVSQGHLSRVLRGERKAGRTAPVDETRPGLGERPLRPYWRITRAAVLDLAARMEKGI